MAQIKFPAEVKDVSTIPSRNVIKITMEVDETKMSDEVWLGLQALAKHHEVENEVLIDTNPNQVDPPKPERKSGGLNWQIQKDPRFVKFMSQMVGHPVDTAKIGLQEYFKVKSSTEVDADELEVLLEKYKAFLKLDDAGVEPEVVADRRD
jgi:hypothetical protein